MAESKNYNKEYTNTPITDIFETENDYVLKMEMPGVLKENLDITLEDDELEIIGKVKVNNDDGDTVNRDKINAGLENGILTLTLAKSEEVKPKKIEVNVH